MGFEAIRSFFAIGASKVHQLDPREAAHFFGSPSSWTPNDSDPLLA